MSLGTPEIIVILLVALLVFGPHRLPEVGRQVGAAIREMRRIQDTVRGELDMVLHPEHGTSSSDVPDEPGSHSVWSPDVDVESTDVTSANAYEEVAEVQAGNDVGIDDVTSDNATSDPVASDPAGSDATGSDPASDVERRFLGPPDSFI